MTSPFAIKTSITRVTVSILCLYFTLLPLGASATGLAHDMSVSVLAESGEIVVEDTVRVDRKQTVFEFVLNAGYVVRAENGTLHTIATSEDGLRTAYRVTLQTATDVLKLHYRGKPRFSERTSLGGMPQGIVSGDGVYLDASSSWYPLFGIDFDALNMAVKLPDGWQSVSIGRRTEDAGRVSWSTDRPHDDLYLIAGRFIRHARQHGDIELSVWLLEDDPVLAERYLALMGDYIDHYSRLIGDYPYAKFAVVENHWQTGFGMPSFTLLGSQVLRLPFIPYTSLPHEILHNWWGNGVWVDYGSGNWSEGLTAYLADHWMQERQGKAEQYRLKALQRYSNFAAAGHDLPLLAFTSRHNDASQSIGYSKSLMVFHMLRNELGDTAFIEGLRRLWQERRFSRVGFEQALRSIIGSDERLATRYLAWLQRTGAPRLRVEAVESQPQADGYHLSITISQEQDAPFDLVLPIAVTLEGQPLAEVLQARVKLAQQTLEFDLPHRPLRVDIDPAYDVLRLLDASEQPPALNRLFGGTAWLVLPSAAPAGIRDAWMQMARQWQTRYPGLRTVDDREAATLDPKADRLILGWDNTALTDANALFARDDQALKSREADIDGESFASDTSSIVLVSSSRDGVTTGFIGADTPDAIAMLTRKLPHYGSYGRLVFDNASGIAKVKDALTPTHPAMSRQLGTTPTPLRLPPRGEMSAD